MIILEVCADADSPLGDSASPNPDVESQTGARRELARVQQALETLDEQRRAAFVMYELDGFSVPEIATVLGIGHNTLYSHLRRARQHVHACLSDRVTEVRDEQR